MDLPFEDRILEKNRILQMRNQARQENLVTELDKKEKEACTFRPQTTRYEDGASSLELVGVTGGDRCADLYMKANRKYKPELLGEQAK